LVKLLALDSVGIVRPRANEGCPDTTGTSADDTKVATVIVAGCAVAVAIEQDGRRVVGCVIEPLKPLVEPMV